MDYYLFGGELWHLLSFLPPIPYYHRRKKILFEKVNHMILWLFGAVSEQP